MNTNENIAYLEKRRKAGINTADLSPANAQAYEVLSDLTENFTEMDNITADASFEKMLDNLVVAMKATSEPVAAKKKVDPKRNLHAVRTKGNAKKLKRTKSRQPVTAGASFTERMRKAKEAKKSETVESSETTADSTTRSKPKSAKAARPAKEKTVKAKAEKAAKGPDKQTEAYLHAKHVKGVAFEIGLIKRFISLCKKSTKEQIITALATFQKSFHAGKWSRSSPVINELRAIQAEYLRVLNGGKAPYQIDASEQEMANYVAIVGGEKVYKSVELLNKFVGWQAQAKNEKQIHLLLAEAINAKAKGKIAKDDPYADRVDTIIHVLEKAKAGQPFKPEATALSGLAGMLGCGCTKPMAGLKGRKVALKRKVSAGAQAAKTNTAAKKKARTPAKKALGDLPTEVSEPPAKSFPGLITSAQIMNVTYKKYTFSEPWGKLFGEPQTNANVMVWGEPGQGKSTFAFKFARYLATSIGKVLYVSSEEIRDGMPSFTIRKKLELVGGSVPGWDFAGDTSKLTAAHKFLIVDSVNDSKLTRSDLKDVKKMHPDLFVVLIFQATKDGKFKGENDWGHDVDVVLEVADGKATTTKNRFAPLTTVNFF